MKYFKTADEKNPLLKTLLNPRQKCLWGSVQGRILISRTNVPLLLRKFPPECSNSYSMFSFSQLALLEMISKWSRKLRKGEDYSFVMKPLDRDWEKLFLMEILMRLTNINFLLYFCLFIIELLPLLFFPTTSDWLTPFSVWMELHVMTACRF